MASFGPRLGVRSGASLDRRLLLIHPKEIALALNKDSSRILLRTHKINLRSAQYRASTNSQQNRLDRRRPHRARLSGPTCARNDIRFVRGRYREACDRRGRPACGARRYLRARRTSETLFQSGMPFSSPSFACAQPRFRTAGARLGGARAPDREDSCDLSSCPWQLHKYPRAPHAGLP